MKELIVNIRKLSFLTVLIPLLLLVSCSSSDDSGKSNIPAAGPADVAVIGKSGELVLQFSKVAGIGIGENIDDPVYEVEISPRDEKGNDTKRVSLTSNGTEAKNDGSRLMKIIIKKVLANGEVHGKDNVYKYSDLTDGKEYNVYVRTYFKANNVRSEFEHVIGVPIPKPQPITNLKVESGDKRLVFSWDKKKYEEYFIGIDKDCPPQDKADKWDLSNLVTNKYRVFSLKDNTEQHSYCAVAINANGKGKWIFSKNNNVQGKDATAAPDKPTFSLEEGNKKLVIKFKPVLTEESTSSNKSVSKYSVMYKKSDENSYTTKEISIDTLEDDGAFTYTIIGLENNATYSVKIKAENSQTSSGVIESEEKTGTPKYIEPNFNDLDSVIGQAETSFIYAENVPHSDFWRISERKGKGVAGRPDTDRLVRGKETAIGTLFSEAIKEYYNSINPDNKADFAFLIGDMINNGINQNQNITPRIIKGILNSDYHEDTLYLYELKGSDIISKADLNVNLDNYPAISKGQLKSLLGQAASVYRNGHYGGSGGTFRNGKYWGLPSNELSYTIEYKKYMIPAYEGNSNQEPYTIEGFKKYFQTKCKNVNMDTFIDNTTSQVYDAVNDPSNCYILTYEQANPAQGSPTGKETMGYKRGKIKEGSVKINGQPIDLNKTYKVLTNSSMDKYYEVFISKTPKNTNIKLLDAVNYYIYDKTSIKASDYLTGKVKLEGGVPGDPTSDYKKSN